LSSEKSLGSQKQVFDTTKLLSRRELPENTAQKPEKVPNSSQKDITSSWITARKSALNALHKILGPSYYVAREGTNTGGANGVFWVNIHGKRPGNLVIIGNLIEGAKKKVSQVQMAMEEQLVFPLLRGCDVQKWVAQPKQHFVLTHKQGARLKAIPETKMSQEYPKAFAFFKNFEPILRQRPAFKRYFKSDAPFYSIFNIGDYTFSPWKVVWREQAAQLTAAVIGSIDSRPIIPDHKLMLVDVDNEPEAHYLCAVLNSSPVRLAVASYGVEIQINTHVLGNIAVPKFNKSELHFKLAMLSKQAHEVSLVDGGGVGEIEENIDSCVSHLWGLKQEELKEIKKSLEEM